jgi:hypothetical protein
MFNVYRLSGFSSTNEDANNYKKFLLVIGSVGKM